MDDDVESTGSDHSTQDQELPGYKSDRRFRKSLSVLTDRACQENCICKRMHVRAFEGEEEKPDNISCKRLFTAAIVKSDIKTLQNEADHLEHLTALVQQGIEGFVTDEHVQKHAYVTQQDLLSIQDLKEQMKFTVKAPAGATLTVPVPNMKATSPYEIILSSARGPIDAFLICDTPLGPKFKAIDRHSSENGKTRDGSIGLDFALAPENPFESRFMSRQFNDMVGDDRHYPQPLQHRSGQSEELFRNATNQALRPHDQQLSQGYGEYQFMHHTQHLHSHMSSSVYTSFQRPTTTLPNISSQYSISNNHSN
eukprot:gene7105-435_t